LNPVRRKELKQRHAHAQRRSTLLAWGLSVATHLVVFTALFWPPAKPAQESAPIPVTLVQLPKPELPPGPPGPPDAPKSVSPHWIAQPPRHAALSPATTPAQVKTAIAEPAPDALPDTSDVLDDSQLAGAISADAEGGAGSGGGGGGGCDTARIVQQALRRDPLVRDAVEDAHRLGKAVMLWNGDWVRSGDQDGKGMSAVREAIIWELAFTPEACRNKPLHGVVLLSLADGSTRFAIGAGDWRWSDLLDLHR
jgi:hypothetical protein